MRGSLLTDPGSAFNALPVTIVGARPLDRTLTEVRRIVLSMLAPYPARVYLFGSRARRDEHRASDVDIAILPETPLPADVLAALREALEESTVPVEVEIVDLSHASLDLRARVLREGVPWND
jgi:predicted nucleotidyltransferase